MDPGSATQAWRRGRDLRGDENSEIHHAHRSRPVMGRLFERLRQEIKAEAWVIDAARRHPRSRQLRSWIEKRRSARIVERVGSVDAALDMIVERAIAGTHDTADANLAPPGPDAVCGPETTGLKRSANRPVREPSILRVGVLAPLPVSGIEGGNERQWRSQTFALNQVGYDAELEIGRASCRERV